MQGRQGVGRNVIDQNRERAKFRRGSDVISFFFIIQTIIAGSTSVNQHVAG